MPAAQLLDPGSRGKRSSSSHLPAASSNGNAPQPPPPSPEKVSIENGSENGTSSVSAPHMRAANGNGNSPHQEQTNGHGHLVTRRRAPFKWDQFTFANKAQLCAYPDCLGKNLPDLQALLGHPELRGAIHGLHLLPISKSTADRGFAPKNYTEIDPKFGTWEDVDALASSYDLTLDLMANHIGRASDEFQDFKRKGRASKYYDMFIHWKDVFDDVGPTSKELDMVYTRKPAFPYIDVEHDDGTSSRIWNTFGEDQLDINPDTELGRDYICGNIKHLAERNAKMIRLDAVGYLTKKRGTRCFFNEPEIWTYLDYIREAGEANNVELLAEVHEHYTLRLKLAEKGFWVYDFCLPMLVLSALHRSDGGPLRRWLQMCPFRQVTCLDTHDGFGVPDVEDVLTTEQITETESSLCGCKETLQWTYSSEQQKFIKHNSAVGTTHQHNCTMYSSIQGRANWYLLARAIQVFTPGIPMIYYVGLLAGTNDVKLAESTGSDRFLNRHYYSTEEAMEQLKTPVVRSLLKLLRFRNDYPAFQGEMIVNEALDEHLLSISWEHANASTTLSADLRTKEWRVTFKCLNSGHTKTLDVNVEESVLCCELSCAVPSTSCACSAPSHAVKSHDHEREMSERSHV